MAFFLAVRPPRLTAEVLAAGVADAAGSLRPEPPEHLHVTLRYFGRLDDSELARIGATLDELSDAASSPPIELGPRSMLLGRDGALVLPATGVDLLAADIDQAFLGLDLAPRDLPFFGHLTLARRRDRQPIPADRVGQEMGASFIPEAIELLDSALVAGTTSYSCRKRAAFAS